MTASRFGGFAAAAVAGLAVMFLTTGNASAEETSTPSTSETPSSVPPTTAPATDLAASTTVAACEITTADVDLSRPIVPQIRELLAEREG